MIWKSRPRYGPLLQHHCQPPMAVAWAFTRWPSHFQLNCSARSPRTSGPSSILRLLTHVFSWPILLSLSPSHAPHDVDSPLSQSSLTMFLSCFVFLSRFCPAMAFNLLLHTNCRLPGLVWFWSTSTSLAPTELPTLRTSSSDLEIRFLAVFLHNSSMGLAHWCTHQSGPIRVQFVDALESFFSFPFLTPPPTLACFPCRFSL